MSEYVIVGGWCVMTFYFLANGIFALRNPTGWLRARWTAKRSMKLDTPVGTVRELGTLFTAAGILLTYFCYQLILEIIPGPGDEMGRGRTVVEYVILACWWLGALNFLVNGVLALLFPSTWLRATWTSKPPNLSSVTLDKYVRLIGLVYTLVGGSLALFGYPVTSRILTEKL